MRWIVMFVLVFINTVPRMSAQQAATETGAVDRRYAEGASHYVMTGDNDGWRYTIQALDVVKRDASGHFYEEISWSGLTSNTQQALTAGSLALRQTVSLDDPASYMKIPNLAGVQPVLIGPITDTLTLYSDLMLAMGAKLVRPGQTAYISRTTPNSWADGQRVVLGQDVVDFALKVETVNPAEHSETILIQHVPPPELHVQLPARWMQATASTKPNNFVQVVKQDDGFIAETGKETFEVRLVVDTRDGHMLSATMHNPVLLTTRTCADKELDQCGPETRKTTVREITWKQIP